jgi:hypothetical protein
VQLPSLPIEAGEWSTHPNSDLSHGANSSPSVRERFCLGLGPLAGALDAQWASAANARLIDFTEQLVPPDQIKLAGYDGAVVDRRRRTSLADTTVASQTLGQPCGCMLQPAVGIRPQSFSASMTISTSTPGITL